jgi:hypothetical protein
MNLIHHTSSFTEYPDSLWRLRKDVPNVSFPDNPTAADLAPFNRYLVTPTPPPEVDLSTHRVEEAPLPTRRPDGSWVQAWIVRDVTPEEKAAWDVANAPQPDWMAFGIDLAMHPGITALYESLPGPVAGGLSVGLNEAGKGDPRLFFGLWSRLLAAGAISAELLGAIAVMAVEHHLPQSFMEALRPSET